MSEARNTPRRALRRLLSKILRQGLCGFGRYGFLASDREPPVATMMRDMMKGSTAKAVAAVRAPVGLESPVVLITLVLLGLLTHAAWMHAT